jgi:hypothetical protein
VIRRVDDCAIRTNASDNEIRNASAIQRLTSAKVIRRVVDCAIRNDSQCECDSTVDECERD